MDRRAEAASRNSPHRRKTRSNACHRCKTKKLRCHYIGQMQSTCCPCEKSDAECVFDTTPDGVPRGAAYIASLEAQVTSLKNELYQAQMERTKRHSADADDEGSLLSSAEARDLGQRSGQEHIRASASGYGDSTFSFTEVVTSLKPSQNGISGTNSDITPFNMLQAAPSPSGADISDTLPSLPSDEVANSLIEAAYLYTQARYCIVDWIQFHDWHKEREKICYTTSEGDLDSQTGAYFIWIVYAIGARFSTNHQHSSASFFSRARIYIRTVLSLQNLTTLQGILALVQYSFRASAGPSVWHLVGVCVRLCIELGYHRSATVSRDAGNAYVIELRKRFFWCSYSFDRMVSYISKRPFGIADSDIDVEVPLEIDLTLTDGEAIRELQSQQALVGDEQNATGTTTEMSSVLHQLRLDRLRSRIMTRFMCPRALPPTTGEVWELLSELDSWRQQASQELPAPFPQHSKERVHATWLHVALLLLRPVLSQGEVDQELLLRCAILSADACENARVLSLSPRQQPSAIQIYHCFNCGISLLQCLALQPTILAPRRIVRAIVACSSALAIYTKTLATASIFLELFEKLSDSFLGSDEGAEAPEHPDIPLSSILQEIIASPPAEMPRILRNISEDKGVQTSHNFQFDTLATDELTQELISHHLDFAAIGSNVFPSFDANDFREPFEMFYDMAQLYDSRRPSV